MTLPVHRFAEIFPPLQGDAFIELVADVREYGLRDPIVLLGGRVLDGRNRYNVLKYLTESGELLGEGWGHRKGEPLAVDALDPPQVWFTTFNTSVDGDPLEWVASKNLRRRHLDDDQRRMVGARLVNARQGRPADPSETSQVANIITRERAAEMVASDVAGIDRARSVIARAVPEVTNAVDEGKLSVSAASNLAQLPTAQQQGLIAALPRDQAGNLTADAIKQLRPLIKEVRVVEQAQKRERREEREVELAQKIADLPDAKFGVIYADPEWRFEPYSRDSGMDRAADNHYPTSVTEAIAARPVSTIAADDCVLFLWATAPMLPDALQVMAAWGFAYRSHMIWKKDRVGTGYWFRNRHELLLIGTKGSVPAPAQGDQWHSVVDQMVQQHSAKPDVFYELIEKYFPRLPKIELNARRARPGWTSWGLEAPKTNNSDLPDDQSSPAGEATAAAPSSTSQAVAAQFTDAHGSTASAVAGAAVAAATVVSSMPDDVLELPAFLKRDRDTNVAPFMREAS